MTLWSGCLIWYISACSCIHIPSSNMSFDAYSPVLCMCSCLMGVCTSALPVHMLYACCAILESSKKEHNMHACLFVWFEWPLSCQEELCTHMSLVLHTEHGAGKHFHPSKTHSAPSVDFAALCITILSQVGHNNNMSQCAVKTDATPLRIICGA
jgi:hypothetical protein